MFKETTIFYFIFVYIVFEGLLKPKNYDWKDSNLALFGSDLEKQVKSKQIIVHLNQIKC